jgi:eukaryotic-like serine/threonine-protein kinase
VKMIRLGAHAGDDPDDFHAEAQAVARLQHPNIVQIHEVFELLGRSFISLEFLDGGSLKQTLADGPKEPRQAAALIEVIARAIAYAHRRGVVHRDLKPANVLMTADGVPKVVDFGLAKLLTRNRAPAEPESPGRRSAIVGTPGYMAPEQFGNASDQDGLPADVFALGAILYESLTGQTPLGMASYFEVLKDAGVFVPAPPSRSRPGVPRDLDAICVKCLQADPARRYPDAGELAEDLRRFQAGEPVRARKTGTIECAWKWARRSPAWAALAAVSALAVLSMLVGSFWYNARLSTLARREERQRAVAEQQARLFRDQLELSRHSLYALQLTHVESSLKSNPGLGLAMLNDARYCPADLRDFTWGYFLRLCKRRRLALGFNQHLGLVNAVAVSPDGRLLAVGGGIPGKAGTTGQVKFFEMDSTRVLGTLVDRLGPVEGVAFSPDGRTLATAGGAGSGVLRLWDVPSREERLTVAAHTHEALSTAFRPDGLAVASAGGDGRVRLWDARTGGLRAELEGHEGAVRSVAFSPDGSHLATGGLDGSARLWEWEAPAGQPVLLSRGIKAAVHAVAFSPDGKLLASAGADKNATLWDLSERRPRSVLRGHTAAVRSLAFSPDGSTLITGGDDCVVRIWRVEDGREVTALNIHSATVTSLAFNAAGDVFVSGSLDQTTKVWDLVQGRQRPPMRGHQARVAAVAFTSDGTTLITAGRDRAVRFWNRAEDRVRASLEGSDGPYTCLALSDDDRLLALGSRDGKVKLWGLAGNHGSLTLRGHTEPVTAIAFGPEGRRLASASLDATVRLWDPSTGRCLATLSAHPGGALGVDFSPDGTIVATVGEDKTLRFWEAAGGRRLASLRGHAQGILSVAFHPDGRTVATGGKDRLVKLWDVKSLTESATLWGHNHWVYAIAFSPDGKTMASSTGDPGPNAVGEVKLWDAATGHVRATFEGQTSPVAFSPDGRTLLTGNLDETFNLLEAAPEFSPGSRVSPGGWPEARAATSSAGGGGLPRRE